MLWLAPALRSVPTNKKTLVAAGHFRSCGVLVIVVGRPTDNIDEKNYWVPLTQKPGCEDRADIERVMFCNSMTRGVTLPTNSTSKIHLH